MLNTREFSLVVPSHAERQLTGLILAGERTIYGRLARVELHAGESAVRFFSAGVRKPWEKMNRAERRFQNQVVLCYNPNFHG